MSRLLFLGLVFLFSFIDHCQANPVRSLFVWSLEDQPVLSSKKDIEELIHFAIDHRISTLFVQVYRSNVAWFDSQVADSTPYQNDLKKISEDSFAYLIKRAHEQNIQVHAWMNMLSLGNNNNAKLLQKYGPSILTRNVQPKKSLADYKIDNQYFLEPSNINVRTELSKLVKEVLLAYPDLDGIQFDYIRYPDEHPFYGYSKDNIERFKKVTGRKRFVESDPKWKQWKRDQVTELLTLLVKKAHSIRPHIHISTTGCLSYVRAYEEALQDWPSWINSGLIEFVTVMNYPPDAKTFKKNVEDIKPQVKDFSKVNVALGAYKEEQTTEDFRKQLESCQESGARGCVLFHYNTLLKKHAFSQLLEK
jgi:uncharacterized lipoprotein YddW (UPF0748 family)